MKHSIDHDLDDATAKKVLGRAFDQYKAKYSSYDPKLTWTSDRTAGVGFSAKGVHLRGQISLRPRAIDVDLDVPLLLRVFQKKAFDVIEREVRFWIDRAHAGEL